MMERIFSLKLSVTCVRFFYIHYIDIYTSLNTVCTPYLELTKSDAQISDQLMVENKDFV